MNRRTFELLFGAVSAAVGLAVALYTAVIATAESDKKTDGNHDTGECVWKAHDGQPADA